MTRERKEIRIGILTPYLTMGPGISVSECCRQRYQGWEVGMEIGDKIVTPTFEVYLDKLSDGLSLDSPGKSAMSIIGSTVPAERIVECLKGSGVIFARYSILHGDSSQYSRKMPEEGGYSIDIPKSPAAVFKLLSHDGFLDGIIARDEDLIMDSLEQIRQESGCRVIATPYLREVLKTPPFFSSRIV